GRGRPRARTNPGLARRPPRQVTCADAQADRRGSRCEPGADRRSRGVRRRPAARRAVARAADERRTADAHVRRHDDVERTRGARAPRRIRLGQLASPAAAARRERRDDPDRSALAAAGARPMSTRAANPWGVLLYLAGALLALVSLRETWYADE